MTDLLADVARSIRNAVRPLLGRPEGRGAVGVAVGGDVTFSIDQVAEDVARGVLVRASDDLGGLAWYTEDEGLVVRGRPRRLILLDPIDGTRPAGAGLESATVSIAAAPYGEDLSLGDFDEALVLELGSGTLYRAGRGRGAWVVEGGEWREPKPAPTKALDGAFWVYGMRGRPTIPSAYALADLIDSSGVGGGTFDLGAAAFAMVSVATGRLDAYVDQGQRMIDDIPDLRVLFEGVAGGAVLNNSPYDVAAGLLICREAGAVVTDAHGQPLEARPALGSGAEHQVSVLACATPDLHGELLERLDRGMSRLRRVVERDGVGALAGSVPDG